MSEIRWLIDGYERWASSEGVPIVSDRAVDLTRVETSYWARMGIPGALVHTHARGDYCCLYVLDIPPGGATEPIHHLYEAVHFVVDGQGSVSVDGPDGGQRTFEWGRASLFCLPLNTTYRLFNTSGRNTARLAVVCNLPMVMKQFRDADFVFDTSRQFADRWGNDEFYRGSGVFIPTREQRHMWESNLIPDLTTFDRLTPSPNRGSGSANIQFVLGETTMAAHVSEVGSGAYKKAHIHGDGVHIIQLGGGGYSLYWHDDEEYRRVDWKYGMLHSPGNQEWHQHFNVSSRPGRYLAMSYGGYRFPFTQANRDNILHTYTKKSKIQIEYEDEDPSIRELFDRERERYLAAASSAGENG